MDVDLNTASGVTHIEKMAFAHITMCRNAACRAENLAFFEFCAHLRNRSADFKSRTEWLEAFRAQRIELFAAQSDQLVFFFHNRIANVRRRRKMNRPMCDGLPMQ